MLQTGIRVGEVAGLQVADVTINERSGSVRIRQSKGIKMREALVKQAKRYTDAGYVFVYQDVRGKGRSQGFYAAFENDIEDGYDSVEWAAAQPWSNGKIGMSGG